MAEPLVIAIGDERYTCRGRVPVEILDAVRVELGAGSRTKARSIDDAMRQLSVALDFIAVCMEPEDARRVRALHQAGGLDMEDVAALTNAIADATDWRTGRIRAG